jgi:hypothetical protein
LELVLQILCQTLKIDINCFEIERGNKDNDTAKIAKIKNNITSGYLFLGKLLREYPELERECVLASFSYSSTEENYKLVLKLARQLYSESDIDSDGHVQLKNAEKSGDRLEIVHVQSLSASETPLAILDSLRNLSEAVREDIALLLAKVDKLSWADPWPLLNHNCRQLLDVGHKSVIINETTAQANSKLTQHKRAHSRERVTNENTVAKNTSDVDNSCTMSAKGSANEKPKTLGSKDGQLKNRNTKNLTTNNSRKRYDTVLYLLPFDEHEM